MDSRHPRTAPFKHHPKRRAGRGAVLTEYLGLFIQNWLVQFPHLFCIEMRINPGFLESSYNCSDFCTAIIITWHHAAVVGHCMILLMLECVLGSPHVLCMISSILTRLCACPSCELSCSHLSSLTIIHIVKLQTMLLLRIRKRLYISPERQKQWE